MTNLSPPISLKDGYYITDTDGKQFDLLNLALCYSWPLPGPDQRVSELTEDEENKAGELISGFEKKERTQDDTGRGRDIGELSDGEDTEWVYRIDAVSPSKPP